MIGTLYVVGTPIGNLGDLSSRALEVLRAVDLVACEDTRRTRKLMTRYGVDTRLVALPAHDEARRAGPIVKRLTDGQDIALVTDAGMPGISDPGRRLVAAAVAAGAGVVPIPGPSALTAAVAVSGLLADRFHFLAFPPRKAGERKRLFEDAARWGGAVVLHEAPGRVRQTLEDLARAFGPDRPALVARELTKVHETLERGTLAALAERFADAPKGEITIVVAAGDIAAPQVSMQAAVAEVAARVKSGERLKDACRSVAQATGLPSRHLYQAALAAHL